MTRPLAVVALLALSGCATTHRGPWTVEGGTPAEAAQALALVDAAKRVYPGTALDDGGFIILDAPIGERCFGWLGKDKPIAGCTVHGGVIVLWPHPKLPPDADLTASALPHELAHRAFAVSEAAADAGALLIVLEYRKSLP